jgi:predicted N-acetyltransferase YhbS
VVIRPLARGEIDRLWAIDRSEVIHHVYTSRQGVLTLTPSYCDARGWPPGEVEKATPALLACYDHGGSCHGAFDEGRLIGAMVLDGAFIGPRHDWLALRFLYVSQGDRAKGVGTRLFGLAGAIARERGARHLYISSTPTENTVNFYLRRGCVVAAEPDPELFALEPADIHLLCSLTEG